jgi:glycosidase
VNHPLLYEINTRCWLTELSTRAGRRLTFADIPDSEFEFWQRCGFTHIWLMGVWSLGSRSVEVSLAQWSVGPPSRDAKKIGGSPYAVARYEVSDRLGGTSALAHFRERLNARGMKLLLDFVPNHTGFDHAWVRSRPDFYITRDGPLHDHTRPFPKSKKWFACGSCRFESDSWRDTLQLDYRNPELRGAMITELLAVARQCDGVRCDMAMLVLNEVIERNWPAFVSPHALPKSEFWTEAIDAVRRERRDFILLAEVYWDLETRLQELGFDFTYDKRLYDRVLARTPGEVTKYLHSLTPQFMEHSAHFIENHDEPRVASLLSFEEQRAAALLIAALPGMRFIHEGQISGNRVHANVHFITRAHEERNEVIASFYETLFAALPGTALGSGEWKLLRAQSAWCGNPTHENIVLMQWQRDRRNFDFAVVNLSSTHSQCYAPLSGAELAEVNWRLTDLLDHEVHERDGEALSSRGLYLDLRPHAAQLFHFEAIP